MTYAQIQLQPYGFILIKETKLLFKEASVELQFREKHFLFECVCPAYPSIKALGCPLHHEGPGGSWPIEDAKKEATAP